MLTNTQIQKSYKRLSHRDDLHKMNYTSQMCGLFVLMLITLVFSTFNVQAQENRDAILGSGQAMQHKAVTLGANGQVVQDREAIHPDDSLALVAFYHSMQGDTWVDNAGWLELPVDFWVGVEQVQNVATDEDPEWRVTRFVLPRQIATVPGYIPAEIGNMTYLQRFVVIRNLVVGEIPDEVRNMVNLERWEHNTNYMTGEIPWDAFQVMPRLQRWQQESNLYYGTGIPDHIGDWPALLIFNIRRNLDLSGTIPQGLVDAENLEYLYIGDTQITGDLPNLGHLENLERIRVAGMPLDPGPIWDWLADIGGTLTNIRATYSNRTGVIPEWFPLEMTALREFTIGESYRDHPENPIGGDGADIPDLTPMANLQNLSFYGPYFTGNIPTWLGDMISLQGLYLDGTNFEGPIPGELANLSNLTSLLMYRNHKITGGLPEEFSDLGTLQALDIRNHNSMEIGQLPDWVGDLTSLNRLQLDNTGITGTLPDLSRLTNLQRFNVSDNPGLTGDIDETFFAERQLQIFDISRTGLNVSEVPEWLNSESSRQNLSMLGLAGLGIEGPIPDWIGDLSWLSTLALNDNSFSGTIPSGLGSLFQMDSLNLANNQLSGPLPENFANIGRVGGNIMVIESLILSGNEDLEGFVPFEMTDASFMRHFRIDGTKLCLAEGSDTWVDDFPNYALSQFPSKYYSIDLNEEFCDQDVSATPPAERAFVFQLNQNYPNPFNPATTISYEIPAESHVALYIYNVVGQKVATLVYENQRAGSHEVNFDATRLASGSYIYRLEAGDRTLTRSMMLIK